MSSKSRNGQKRFDPSKVPSQANARLQKAVALHQQGQVMQAEAIYMEVLQAQPRNYDALHLLGVIALQKNDPQRAVDLIGKAISNDPK